MSFHIICSTNTNIKAIVAITPLTIQKRIVIWLSGQFFASKWWWIGAERKTFLFLIIAVAIVLILVSLSISTGVVKNAADDFNSSEDVNDDEINELQQPKNWEERIIITSGPWGELINSHVIEYTKPYYIKSDIWRVNWSMQGTNCNFEFKVWKVGNIGSSNYIDTIYDEASGTLDIDDGAGYYYFELRFENLYYYQFRLSEYVWVLNIKNLR